MTTKPQDAQVIGWRTDAWSKSGMGHFYQASASGLSVAFSLCGRGAMKKDLQPKSTGRCLRCEKILNKGDAR